MKVDSASIRDTAKGFSLLFCGQGRVATRGKDDMSISPLPAREDSSGPAIRYELGRQVRAWRLRLDPSRTPGLRPRRSTGQHRRTVSQERLAQLVGCSTSWFGRLELGHPHNYSDRFLTKVAEVLQLDSDETRLLFLLAGKQPPTCSLDAAPDGLEPVLMAQPWPAYLSDQIWDVTAYNPKMRAWFPWVQQRDANVMRWVFTDPDAPRRLYRWDTEWAPSLLAELRVRQLRRPADPRLSRIIAEILDVNPVARRLWQEPVPHFQARESPRSIMVPGLSRPQLIDVVALQPPQSPDHRLTMLIPAST
ncbi:helix-turn-helix domain-containing protein [Actinoplanes sp. NPDC051343]|uniref:helix-turn-helix domain-containing protein n=1 Tax=Actinoplanes sp. NPDC051343 TaxID=3363906 RepID=UPI0037A5C63C